jgi:hypothetical protein
MKGIFISTTYNDTIDIWILLKNNLTVVNMP